MTSALWSVSSVCKLKSKLKCPDNKTKFKTADNKKKKNTLCSFISHTSVKYIENTEIHSFKLSQWDPRLYSQINTKQCVPNSKHIAWFFINNAEPLGTNTVLRQPAAYCKSILERWLIDCEAPALCSRITRGRRGNPLFLSLSPCVRKHQRSQLAVTNRACSIITASPGVYAWKARSFGVVLFN